MAFLVILHRRFGSTFIVLSKYLPWLGSGWELIDLTLSQSVGGTHMSLGVNGYVGVVIWE
jgi:hypothetical protein